jgi:hypothetical protein
MTKPTRPMPKLIWDEAYWDHRAEQARLERDPARPTSNSATSIGNAHGTSMRHGRQPSAFQEP